jgi:ketol-acid reductoisomerase
LKNIQAGNFAVEWSPEQASGYRRFDAMDKAFHDSAFGQAEREVMKEIGLRADD